MNGTLALVLLALVAIVVLLWILEPLLRSRRDQVLIDRVAMPPEQPFVTLDAADDTREVSSPRPSKDVEQAKLAEPNPQLLDEVS
jgi:hypothetical protein